MDTTLREFIARGRGSQARLLEDSIRANNVFQVRALLAAGVSPDCQVWECYSALMLSIKSHLRRYKLACVRALLEAGASTNPIPPSADSPLTAAVERGSLVMVELLLRHGAKPDHEPADAGDFNALETAVLSCRADIVARLCAAGANPNRKIRRCFARKAWPRSLSRGLTFANMLRMARHKETPHWWPASRRKAFAPRLIVWVPVLHAAMACGASDVAEALLAAGADPCATDSDGLGVKDYKNRRKNSERKARRAGV